MCNCRKAFFIRLQTIEFIFYCSLFPDYLSGMLMIQFTGLSGAGKSTIASAVLALLQEAGISTTVIDGDQFRKTICRDLGFSKQDRQENIRRLARYANSLQPETAVVIIAAINPYEETRRELQVLYGALTVWIHCALPVLLERDTKGLYKRALLPDTAPEKIYNMTGINDPYEAPSDAVLILQTDQEEAPVSAEKLFDFIMTQLSLLPS